MCTKQENLHMTPYFKTSIKFIAIGILLIAIGAFLSSCTQSLQVLDGATHAKGSAHVEGYFTDSEADMELCKVPDDYTPEQAIAFCDPE